MPSDRDTSGSDLQPLDAFTDNDVGVWVYQDVERDADIIDELDCEDCGSETTVAFVGMDCGGGRYTKVRKCTDCGREHLLKIQPRMEQAELDDEWLI